MMQSERVRHMHREKIQYLPLERDSEAENALAVVKGIGEPLRRGGRVTEENL
jgi:hypothetical protein